MSSATAFVLAGGQSSRMGSDKALLSFGEQTLLQNALRIAAGAAAQTCIVGPSKLYLAYGDVVEDIFPGCGPLGGIHAALSASQTDLNLVLSVDIPLMTSDFLHWLLLQAEAARELIVLPDAAGGPQPLCAVYRPAVRDYAEQALQRGEYKIARLFTQVPTRRLDEQQIVAAGFSPAIFQNVNTPEEYAQLCGGAKHEGR
jgi:molybdenum cofactor guanylyltransferase